MTMTDGFWRGRTVAVPGGGGFVGSHVVELLLQRGARVIVVDRDRSSVERNLSHVLPDLEFRAADLLDADACLRALRGAEVVLNLAARVAGVGYNVEHQAEMFFDNVRMNAHLLEAARVNGAGRFLVVSSSCVYPRDCTVPTPESEGMRGVPESANEGYGWAKRMSEAQGREYAARWGMQVAVARPYNAYGPRDCFEPGKAHVIPALLQRVLSGQDPLVVWGDGSQSRAFLFVEDFARGLLEITERYACAEPVNLGTDEEIRIRDLVVQVCQAAGCSPRITFDGTKPSGQPRSCADVTVLRERVGFCPVVSIRDGLRRTVEWYRRSLR